MNSPEPEGETIRVLIVDDDENDFGIVRDFLAAPGPVHHEVTWEPDYDAALEQLQSGRYDVCLLDYTLGDRSGLDLLREASERGVRAPVILLTQEDDQDLDLIALDAGASDYLVKSQLTAPLLRRAIQYARRNREMTLELEDLATRDPLTGLYNRRSLEGFLQDEFERFNRQGCGFSFFMADLDHFKRVNDTYGHQAGDQVLRQVAALLESSLRQLDRIARYGGEEIAVLAPGLIGTEALRLAERLCRAVSARPLTVQTESGETFEIPITISVGVASVPRDALSPEKLIYCADEALYKAKEGGRNRVVLYSPEARPGLRTRPVLPPRNAKSAGIAILVAGADDVTRREISRTLQRAKLRNSVHFLGSSDEFMQYLREVARSNRADGATPPGLIFIDGDMPELPGGELQSVLSSTPLLDQVPIVLLTRHADGAENTGESGIAPNAFLTKPVTLESFVEAIRELGGLWMEIVGPNTD